MMVSTTAGGRPLKSAASRPGATHGGSIDLDAGAIWCRAPERGGPFSEKQGHFVGRTIELSRDVNSTQWLELRVTPEEEMAGELWHAVWSYTSQPVDVRDRRSVVRAD